ncbi:MAG: hypothetical protein ABIG92_05235, partial [Candidatus Omnitrophota bacterium]
MTPNYELNLRDYWNIFIKRRFIIFFFFLVIFAVSVVYTNLQKVLYRVSGVIEIKPAEALSSLYGRVPLARVNPSELSSYSKKINSFFIIEEALRKLNLITKSDPQKKIQDMVSRISGSISTSIIESTNMICVDMVSESPIEATDILNKVLLAFKLDNLEDKNKQIKSIREFVEGQLENASDQLRKSENRLRELTLKDVGRKAISITDKITKLEEKRTELVSKYTDIHPDIIKIDEEILEL